MIYDCTGFPLDQRSIDAVAHKFSCRPADLMVIHGTGLSKRASSLVRNNPGLVAVQDSLKRQDWWAVVQSNTPTEQSNKPQSNLETA